MDGMNKLKYISTEQMFEGIIVELHDASVTIGQEVGFLMSYPEVLAEEPDEHYKTAIYEHERRRAEARRKREEAGEEN